MLNKDNLFEFRHRKTFRFAVQTIFQLIWIQTLDSIDQLVTCVLTNAFWTDALNFRFVCAGAYGWSTVIRKWCGLDGPGFTEDLVSKETTVLFTFRSDSSSTATGVRIQYWSVPRSTCVVSM